MFFSADLRIWRDLGLVLVRPDYEGSGRANYWAPEFIEHGGKFFFYYTADSFGDPERRFVRVACGDRVEGLYADSGEKLVEEPSVDGYPHFVSSACRFQGDSAGVRRRSAADGPCSRPGAAAERRWQGLEPIGGN